MSTGRCRRRDTHNCNAIHASWPVRAVSDAHVESALIGSRIGAPYRRCVERGRPREARRRPSLLRTALGELVAPVELTSPDNDNVAAPVDVRRVGLACRVRGARSADPRTAQAVPLRHVVPVDGRAEEADCASRRLAGAGRSGANSPRLASPRLASLARWARASHRSTLASFVPNVENVLTSRSMKGESMTTGSPAGAQRARCPLTMLG